MSLRIAAFFAVIVAIIVALLLCALNAALAAEAVVPTFNFSKTIDKGGSFQTVLVPAKSFARRYIFIQNNNVFPRDCWIFVGEGKPSKALSFILRSYQVREWHAPFAPAGEIQATCDRDGDTLYIEAQ